MAYPSDIAFDVDHVLLNMTGGMCADGVTPRTAEIHFRCNPGSLGIPTLVENNNNCSFAFDWPSSAACPIAPVVGSSCQVQDPASGHLYDLTPLMKSGDYV